MEEIGRIVPRALKTHLQRDKAPLLAVVAGLWPRVAGKAIAEQSRPVAFSGGKLTLSASNEEWATQLQALSGEICSAVNKALGQTLVRYVRVRVGPACRFEEGTSVANADRKLLVRESSHSSADIDALASLDAETRTVLSRSIAKYFARLPRRTN